MSSPLLEVKKLTLRFRGLTAVDKVDIAVDPGQIYAVIGPNGAGKTSLFNAITGIYEPTEGEVRFEGKDLRAPLVRAHYAWWSVLGVAIGILALFLASDPDKMWAAVIKNNYRGPSSKFSIGKVVSDFFGYLAAHPRIEQAQGRFWVATYDGKRVFGSSRTEDDALARLDALPAMAAGATVREEAGQFAIVAGGKVIDKAPSKEQAEQRIKAAADSERAASRARWRRFIVFLLGTLIGAAGGYAVWQQTRRTPSSVATRGIARTFQNIRLFQDMTVLENVLVGGDRHLVRKEARYSLRHLRDFFPPLALTAGLAILVACLRWNVLGPAISGFLLILWLGGVVAYLVRIAGLGAFSRADLVTEAGAAESATTLLEFVGLDDRATELAKNLPYGDQRRLEIARALATRPRLLLLDEPAAGMNPSESAALMKLIRDIRDRDVTVLLIEHHMKVVMGISDRISVLEYGRKIAEGTPDEIRANPKVIEAYLGKEELG